MLTADAVLFSYWPPSATGLSFYSDATIAVRLRMREATVVAAREELLIHNRLTNPPLMLVGLAPPAVKVAYAAQCQCTRESSAGSAS